MFTHKLESASGL